MLGTWQSLPCPIPNLVFSTVCMCQSLDSCLSQSLRTKPAQTSNSQVMCWVVSLSACVTVVLLQIPSGNLGMFGNSGAAQARTMQQPQQPPVQPLNSSQPSLRAQVPQFLSPQVRQHLTQTFPLSLELFSCSVMLLRLRCLAVSVLFVS